MRPTVTSTPKAVSDYKLPLLAYTSDERELALIQQAVFREQTVCAARFGVDAEPQQVDLSGIRAQINIQRRYGLIERAEVAQFGYGYPPDPTQEQKESGTISARQASVDEVLSGQTPNGTSQLTDAAGNPLPEGGCGAEGWRVIRGDLNYDYDALPQQLLEDARQSFQQDPGFKEAEQDWAACMQKAGYSFKHRSDARDSVQSEDEARQREMALLDVDCALQVNYVGRAMAIDGAYQDRLIKEHEGDLRGVLEANRQLMERVKKALR